MTRKGDRQIGLVSGTVASPIGPLVAIEDETDALFMVEFADCAGRMDRWLRHRLASGRYQLRAGAVSAKSRQAFAAYFDGEVGFLRTLPVGLDGTAFQNEMWTALREVAPGETLAYGAFAERLGRPKAARAIGHANGSNPLSVVVPCHRLVGANGALTNYGGGLERKRWLLDHEARYAGS
nr:methylated-DNA--[protein]-cysteine S-methyltransferase [Mesorhizobium loti]